MVERRDLWKSVLTNASDKPSTRSARRAVTVPIVTAVASIVLLVVINPPFICTDHKLSLVKLFVWGVIAAISAALLTIQGVFAPMCSV